jgi:hypothetical protein
MMLAKIILILLMFIVFQLASAASTGQVASIHGGDSFAVVNSTNLEQVKLVDVESPSQEETPWGISYAWST